MVKRESWTRTRMHMGSIRVGSSLVFLSRSCSSSQCNATRWTYHASPPKKKREGGGEKESIPVYIYSCYRGWRVRQYCIIYSYIANCSSVSAHRISADRRQIP